MANDRRIFIKTTATAGIGLGLTGSIFSAEAKSIIKEGGRIGVIGLDTSHVVAFTKSLNEGQDKLEYAGFKVVATYYKLCQIHKGLEGFGLRVNRSKNNDEKKNCSPQRYNRSKR